MKITIITGPPGAGKGTQAELLVERLDLHWFSVGQALRASKDPEVISIMHRGQLVSPELTTRIVMEELLGSHTHVLIDGYPRNIRQVELLEANLAGQDLKIDSVIYLNIEKNMSRQRILARGRADDTEAAFATRWEIYENETLPVIAYYQQLGVLEEIDGSGPIEDVAELISEVL